MNNLLPALPSLTEFLPFPCLSSSSLHLTKPFPMSDFLLHAVNIKWKEMRCASSLPVSLLLWLVYSPWFQHLNAYIINTIYLRRCFIKMSIGSSGVKWMKEAIILLRWKAIKDKCRHSCERGRQIVLLLTKYLCCFESLSSNLFFFGKLSSTVPDASLCAFPFVLHSVSFLFHQLL